MEMRYDSEADILTMVLRTDPPVDAVEEPGGVVVSYGEDGEPVTVEFLNAARRKLVQHGQMSVTLQSG